MAYVTRSRINHLARELERLAGMMDRRQSWVIFSPFNFSTNKRSKLFQYMPGPDEAAGMPFVVITGPIDELEGIQDLKGLLAHAKEKRQTVFSWPWIFTPDIVEAMKQASWPVIGVDNMDKTENVHDVHDGTNENE